MTFETRTGDLLLLKSEMVHVSEDRDLTIKIDDLSISFIFSDDQNKDKISLNLKDNKTLEVICNKFENSLGEGIVRPFPIGEIEEKELYLSFYVWTIDLKKNRRIINYCLYSGKNISHE